MGDRPGVETQGRSLKPLDRILRRWRFRKARQWIAPGASVLDVGGYDEAFFEYLGDRLGEGIGLDPSLDAPIDGHGYRLVPGRFPADAPRGRDFDVITMLAVLEHFPEEGLAEVAEACAELLRPGGLVVLTVPGTAVDSILHALSRLRLITGIGVEEHHGFDPRTTPKVFGEPLFRLRRWRRFQLGLNNLFVFERLPSP